MITGAQIRAARGLLGWRVDTLAARAGVSEMTIRRAESVDGTPSMRTPTLLAIQRALEDGGVMFQDASDQRPGGEGVRRRR
jgi:transcriptional regulator with XRE-family HTH domain